MAKVNIYLSNSKLPGSEEWKMSEEPSYSSKYKRSDYFLRRSPRQLWGLCCRLNSRRTTLGTRATLVMSTISKRKDKRFDIEAYYRNESKTFWFGLLTIGTKAKHFDLVHKKLFCTKSFLFWPKKSGTKQSNLIWSGKCPRQSRTFPFNPKTNRSKQNILIWSP